MTDPFVLKFYCAIHNSIGPNSRDGLNFVTCEHSFTSCVWSVSWAKWEGEVLWLKWRGPIVSWTFCLYFLKSVLKKSSPTSIVPTGMYLSHLSLCFALEFSVEIQKLGNTYFSRELYFAHLKNIRWNNKIPGKLFGCLFHKINKLPLVAVDNMYLVQLCWLPWIL